MTRSIWTKLSIGSAATLLFFIIVPVLWLPRLGWDAQRQNQLYGAILIVGTLLALLIAYKAYAMLVRLVGAINEALLAAREGRFMQLSADSLPKELEQLASSYNSMSETLEQRQHQLHAELRRTALLTRLSIELRESLEPEMIVRDILTAIVANTDMENASIMLVGADGAIELASTINRDQLGTIAPETARQLIKRGVAGWVLRHSRNVVIGDVTRDDRWIALDAQATGGAMVLALTHRRKTFGVLTIRHPESDQFTGQDLLLLEGVAAQAGVALNAAYRHIEERRYREQAFLLFSMGQFLTSERSMTDLAQELLEKSDAVFEARHAALFLAERSDAPLTRFAERSNLALENQPASELATHVFAVAERAWQRQDAITEPLAAGVLGGSAPADTPADELVCVALPLVHNGVAIGAFALVRQAHGGAAFSARVWSMLTTFANVAASAFANMQLVDRLQLRAEELEQLVDERTTQLQRSRDLLRVIIDHLPDGLVLMNADSHILAANRAFCHDVLGVRPQSIVNQPYQTVFQQAEQQLPFTIERQPAAGTTQRVICTAADGKQHWYEVDRYAIASGVLGAAQLIERWRDITRQEQLQRQLLLHEQLTALAQLASSVVHEVGNPLQSIRSCLELCREDDLSGTMNEYLTLADDELERISHWLDRLRDFYRGSGLEQLGGEPQLNAPAMPPHPIEPTLAGSKTAYASTNPLL